MLAAILLVVAMMLMFLTGCNRQVIDTTFSYDNAILALPDGSVISGKIESWKDYDDGDHGVFSGRKSVKLRKPSGEAEERYFCFKVFSYTSTDHRKRFEQCAYTKEKYTARRDSARVVKEAFATGSTRKLNALTDEKEIEGNGWLFVCAPLDQLELILSAMFPRQYLVTDYNTHRAAVIPQRQMEEFIYLYESMPYNIELMNRPLEDYLQKKQRIRITGGVFRGKEGCIMRLHRNTRLVFAFGNMTVAVSYLHAFPFEKVE